MADVLNDAIRSICETQTAREILRQVITELKDVPEEHRGERGYELLRLRLMREMSDYHGRLAALCKQELQQAVETLKKKAVDRA